MKLLWIYSYIIQFLYDPVQFITYRYRMGTAIRQFKDSLEIFKFIQKHTVMQNVSWQSHIGLQTRNITTGYYQILKLDL